MVNFKKRDGKINLKALSEIDSTPIINLYNKWINLESVLKKYSDFQYGMHGFAPGLVYGKPNSILKDLEGSPGVWCFDFTNNITILMFSDGFRKNHFKGTSYELVLDRNPKEEDVKNALEFLFKDFQIKFKNTFPEEQRKLLEITKTTKFKK